MDRIKYTCKNCGWTTSVVAQWADLKPPRCMNAKCNTNFKKTPEALQVDNPKLKAKKKVTKKVTKKVETAKSEQTSSYKKTSSKAKQQQAKEEE